MKLPAVTYGDHIYTAPTGHMDALEADKAGPAAIKLVNEQDGQGGNYDASLLEWGIAEFWFHQLVLGSRNVELWAKPTPVTRND